MKRAGAKWNIHTHTNSSIVAHKYTETWHEEARPCFYHLNGLYVYLFVNFIILSDDDTHTNTYKHKCIH